MTDGSLDFGHFAPKRKAKPVWGVFPWRPDGRYWAEEALRSYMTEDGCDRYIAKHSGKNYVARRLVWKSLT
jgi:hypothetical protein